MKTYWKLLRAPLGFLLAGLFMSVPARAQNVDAKMKTLEQELSQLKSQQYFYFFTVVVLCSTVISISS